MASDIVIEKVKPWKGYSVEWHDGSAMLLARRNRFFSARQTGGPLTPIGHVPIPLLHRIVSVARLGQRFLRSMCYNILAVENGSWFVTFGKRMGILSASGWSEIDLPRPCRVLRGGVAMSPDGALWFGEYLGNPDRRAMSLYRWQPGARRVEVAHEFDAGSICHIHSVSWDPYRKALVCLTGDRKGECRMLISRDGFKTLDVIGAGTEDWRAVSIVSRPDGWVYATDAEFQQNVIAHVDATTGIRRVLGRVDGPVYYSRSWGADDALFGVTAERCVIMPHPEAVLHLVHGHSVQQIARFPKDINESRLAWELFMPGTLHFASGPGDPGYCFVSGVGLRGLDQEVLVLKRS